MRLTTRAATAASKTATAPLMKDGNMSKYPKALSLAAEVEMYGTDCAKRCAEELRRLHAANIVLHDAFAAGSKREKEPTNIASLVASVRSLAKDDESNEPLNTVANVLEAQSRRIATLEAALDAITNIKDKTCGPYWDEISEARNIARAILAKP